MFKHHGPHSESAFPNSWVHSQRRQRVSHPPRRWIIWSASIGIFLPYTFGDTGRYVVAFLIVPAIVTFVALLSQGKRRLMACDIFVWAAGLWMVSVKTDLWTSGALFAAGSDALAFVGSYMLARSFLDSEPSLKEFLRALRFVAFVLIALSVLDTLSGTFFLKNLLAGFFPDPRPVRADAVQTHRSLFGYAVIRAQSTFSHPILYGTFCSVAAAIFVYTETSFIRRVWYYGLCLFGCLLSVSAAPLAGIALVPAVYFYDRCLNSYSQRWKLLAIILTTIICLLFVFSDSPLTLPVRYLTIDPQSGWYRLLIWHNAFDQVAKSPITGADFSSWYQNEILSNSIDSVWLMLSLLYGLPMVALLLLASLSACGAFGRKINRHLISYGILQIRAAFSLVLFLFASLGLTVHF